MGLKVLPQSVVEARNRRVTVHVRGVLNIEVDPDEEQLDRILAEYKEMISKDK